MQLLHEESHLKKWRVMEIERIIWSDKRLYTIGNISEGLIFSFFIDCIYIIFYKRVVTALYSFLFNKDVIFYYIFLKLFLFIESICIEIINKFYLFYFYLPGWFSCYSLASAKLWLTKRSSCPATISYC